MSDIAFYIVAGLVILFSVGVVVMRNMLHAAIFLVSSFTWTAVLYLLMDVEFAAIMQLVVYIGGIVVVIVFIILLTSELGEVHLESSRLRKWPPMLLALLCIAASTALIHKYHDVWAARLPVTGKPVTIDQIAESMLSTGDRGFLIPFEIISLLLLTAVIGAIVIARRRDESGEDEP